METKENNSSKTLMWVAVAAIILLSGTVIAALAGWLPASDRGDRREEAIERRLAEESKQAAVKPAPLPSKPAPVTQPKPVVTNSCPTCGVIESTRVINVKGDSDGVGAVGGAVVGGVLGHQVGGGTGKDIATVVGAVGGAYAGNEIEKNMKSSKRYQTTVRFDEGGHRTFSSAQPTNWRPGDRVKVVNNSIVSR